MKSASTPSILPTELAHWSRIASIGTDRFAPLHVVRCLSALGDADAADRAIAKLLLAGDPDVLERALMTLYTDSSIVSWIDMAHGLLQRGDATHQIVVAIADRAHRVAVLFALDARRRRQALEIITHPAILAVLATQGLPPATRPLVAAFVGCCGTSLQVDHFRNNIVLDSAEVALAGRIAVKQFEQGLIADTALANLASSYRDNGELLDYLFLFLRRTPGADFARIMARVPEHGWQSDQLRHAVRALCATGDFWCAEHLVLQIAATGQNVAEIEPVLTYIARLSGSPMLALIRQNAALAAVLPRGDALALAQRLSQVGAQIEAARVLAPHVPVSADAAFAYANALSQGPTDTRSSATWLDVAQFHRSPRINRALAYAMLDDLRYDEAKVLLQKAIDPEGPASEWRELAQLLERIGDHDGWAALIADLEQRFADDPWVQSERLKHDMETGTGSDANRQAQMIAHADDPFVRRAIARRLPIEGKNAEAEAAWQSIANATGKANDHYHHILALCQSGRFEEAEMRLCWIIARFPSDYRLHLKLAQLAERGGRYDIALDCFSTALATEARNLDSRAGIARCLTYLGETARCDRWLDMNETDDVRGTWQLAARAFNAVRSGRSQTAIDSMAVLRARVTQFQELLIERQRADPAGLWSNGAWLKAPGADHADNQARFAADLAWLREGRVALVGNSPRLLEAEHGARIDSNDRIVRLNDFHLAGFERHVGSRTDMWFSSANRLAKPNVTDLGHTRIWLSQPFPQHLPTLGSFSRGRLGIDLQGHRVSYLPPYVHQLSTNLIYPRPSTGFRMIGLLETFVGVPYEIAGFSFFDGDRMHYFDQAAGRLQIGEVHAIDFERDFVREVLSLSPLMTVL